MPINIFMMNVTYSISKFYTKHPSLYVSFLSKNFSTKLLRLAFCCFSRTRLYVLLDNDIRALETTLERRVIEDEWEDDEDGGE